MFIFINTSYVIEASCSGVSGSINLNNHALAHVPIETLLLSFCLVPQYCSLFI
jgi:hypothetical protein